MSRLSTRLARLRDEKRIGLITYLVAGDPSKEATVDFMHAMVEGGADVIELGVPFTDPVADGPVIQAACERALRGGTRLADVFGMVRKFRQRDSKTPVVLMGYLNPLEAVGHDCYAREASKAGADALLVVDLPADEAAGLGAVLKENKLELVCLVAPTTNATRLEAICRSVTSFVYYVSLKGVTGAGNADRAGMSDQLARIRALTDRPIGVGFGISDTKTAVTMAKNADAIIVGSALVAHIAEQGSAAGPGIQKAVAAIRKALDNGISV